MSNQNQDLLPAPIIPPALKGHDSSSSSQTQAKADLFVDYHEKLREAYISIKEGALSPWDDDTHKKLLFQQKSPIGNTVLHVAAMYGNDAWVEKIAKEAYSPNIFTKQNMNGDTPLHVAAKAGHISTVKNLLVAHYTAILSSKHSSSSSHDGFVVNKVQFLDELSLKNNQGNTFFHEAIYGHHEGLLNDLLLNHQGELNFLGDFLGNFTLLITNKEDKSGLYLMIEAGFNQLADQVMAKIRPTYSNGDPIIPWGRSPLHAAISKRDRGILEMIDTRKPEWIHLRYEDDGRMGLHYAASKGYLDGVVWLLRKCSSMASVRDKHGFLPIHLAAYGGHVEVVQKLLEQEHCPYPREMVDNSGRNILHLAIEGGNLKVVKYILKQSNINHELEKMINDKDFNGNTPLHVATLRCYPKIVYELTNHKRVDLNLTNNDGQTALDICSRYRNLRSFEKIITPCQFQTWAVLKLADGAKLAEQLHDIEVPNPPENTKSYWEKEPRKIEQFKERINTLILVATLIATVTFAAGFTLPGGINSDSHKEKGMALMLHNILFKLFMIFNTASMYSAIGVILALIWAQIGDLTMLLYAVRAAVPLLGFSLATLSLAFLTGVELVIRHLPWLATFIGLMSFIFMLIIFLEHAAFLVIISTIPVLKYISRFSILFQMWFIVDVDRRDAATSTHSTPQSSNSSHHSILKVMDLIKSCALPWIYWTFDAIASCIYWTFLAIAGCIYWTIAACTCCFCCSIISSEGSSMDDYA